MLICVMKMNKVLWIWNMKMKCKCYKFKLTGSLVRAGLLTLRPNASSWNCSNCTTSAAKVLLVGESVWTYYKKKRKVTINNSNSIKNIQALNINVAGFFFITIQEPKLFRSLAIVTILSQETILNMQNTSDSATKVHLTTLLMDNKEYRLN